MAQAPLCSHIPRRRTMSYSHASKMPAARSSRPAYHHRKSALSANLTIAKLGAGLSHARLVSEVDDGQPLMATIFPNFCAMCEKQISFPDNCRLYCSESCRIKDSCKPLSAALSTTESMSFVTTTPPSSPPLSPRMIVAPLTPTRVTLECVPVARIPSDFHDATTDLDPTEWKPVIVKGFGSSFPSSEAWRYLSRFYGSDEPTSSLRHSGAEHRSSASLSTLISGTGPSPSLTDTVSVASSCSSNASESMVTTHEYPHRPLPARHNPSFSATCATKGVELVFPHVVSSTEDVVAPSTPESGDAVWGPRSLNEKGMVPIITIAHDVTQHL